VAEMEEITNNCPRWRVTDRCELTGEPCPYRFGGRMAECPTYREEALGEPPREPEEAGEPAEEIEVVDEQEIEEVQDEQQ